MYLQIFCTLAKAYCFVPLCIRFISFLFFFSRAGKMAKTMKEFAASSGSSSPGRDRGGLSLSAVKSMVLGEKEDKFGFDSRDEEKLVSLINAMFNVGRSTLHGKIYQTIYQLLLFIFLLFLILASYSQMVTSSSE